MAAQSFRVEASSVAPRDTVFGLLADIPRWQEWAGPAVPRSILDRPGSPEAFGVGAVRKLGRAPIWSFEEITRFEPPCLLGYELRGGLPVRGYRSEVSLVERRDGGTHLTWASSFDGAPVGTSRLFALFLRTMVGSLARRLCAHADGVG